MSGDIVVECSRFLSICDGESFVRTSLGLRRALPVLGLESRLASNLPLQLLVDVVRQPVRSSGGCDAPTTP